MSKVGVCMCNYNRDGVYQITLNLLFTQEHRDIKFYVCDDASTDNSKQRLIALNRDFHDVFKLYATTENNYINAHNLVLSKVEDDCDYICWCDSDDYISPNKIREQAEFLDMHPDVDVVSCLTSIGKQQVIANTINELKHSQIESLLTVNGMHTVCHFQSVMFRRKCLEHFTNKKYFYDEFIGGRCGEGFLYTLFFMGYKFHNIPTCAYIYNPGKYKNSMSANIVPEFANNLDAQLLKDRKHIIMDLFKKYNPQLVVNVMNGEDEWNHGCVQSESTMNYPTRTKRTGKKKETTTVAPTTEAPATTTAPKRRGRPKKVVVE